MASRRGLTIGVVSRLVGIRYLTCARWHPGWDSRASGVMSGVMSRGDSLCEISLTIGVMWRTYPCDVFWCAVGICRRLVAVDIACVLFVFALVLLYFVCIYGLDGL